MFNFRQGYVSQLLLLLILYAVLLVLFSSRSASADLIKETLSGTMQPFSKVEHYIVSPDGQHVVYRADPETDNLYETFLVPMRGGDAQSLDFYIYTVTFSPDSKYIIGSDNSLGGLYSVPVAGGVPIHLTDLATRGYISPDSNYVVFLSGVGLGGVYELYSVPITGGTPVKLNSDLVSGGSVQWDIGISDNFFIAPDSSRVVYLADQEIDNVWELFSVPITGGTPQKLNDTLVPGGDVLPSVSPREPYHISSDGSRVVYKADQDIDGVTDLYSVPIAGGSSQKLNADPNVSKIDITPDGSRVMYMSGSDIYSVPIAGGTSQLLNSGLGAGYNEIDRAYYNQYVVSPDSNHVIFLGCQQPSSCDGSSIFDIYSVPITGGTPVKLNDFPGGDNSGVSGYRISPDSSRVIYYAWKSEIDDDVYSLFSVPLVGGSTPQKLTDDLDGFSGKFKIDPNSSSVIYHIDQDTTDMDELYRIPITGGASEKLNGSLDADADVYGDFTIASNSNHIVYRAGQPESADGMIELFVTFDQFEIFLPIVLK